MPGKTMSDWQKFARNSKVPFLEGWAEKVETKKEEDLERLRKTRLPQYDLFVLPYVEFSKQNSSLDNFFKLYANQGYKFCVRALPNDVGKQRGYTRVPRQGLKGFSDSREFLASVIKRGEEDLWNIGITNQLKHVYGGVIISGIDNRRRVLCEISNNLERLTSGEEDPLVVFIYDRARIGHITDKLRVLKNLDSCAFNILLGVFRNNIARGSSFDPYLFFGYFEFVIGVDGKERFIDYKINEEYKK